MTLKRMDNVLIVVDDLEAVKAFFIELGLKLEGETTKKVSGDSIKGRHLLDRTPKIGEAEVAFSEIRVLFPAAEG